MAKITNNLPKFIESVERRGTRAVTQAMILGASEASVLTPIASSTLLNSQYRNVEPQSGRIVGQVGYTAEYALPVHDPDNPQNFVRATATKEFLKKGFERAEPNIRAVIKKGLQA